MIAEFSDVDKTKVTKITTKGYTSTASTYGGFYKKNQYTYLSINDGTSSHSWGRLGGWYDDPNGLPAFSKRITTGYIDVYIRIDNQQLTNSHKIKMGKNKKFLANKFIER